MHVTFVRGSDAPDVADCALNSHVTVGQRVRDTDDRARTLVHLVGDDPRPLHNQRPCFHHMMAFEFVDRRQSLATAHQDRGGDALDHTTNETVGHRVLVQGIESGFHCAATVVAEDDDEWHIEHVYGVFDRTEHRIVEHVTCSAHDEHVAETLVEDDLGGYARITATEQHRGGMLFVDQLRAVDDSLARVNGRVVDKSLVTLTKRLPSGNGA